MFPSNIRNDVLNIFRDISPKDTGNTAFNGIQEYPIPNGFEVRLLQHVTPYGIKLDKPTGRWFKGHRGFFSIASKNAATLYLKSEGGYADSMGETKQRVEEAAINTPARQDRYVKSVTQTNLKGGLL